MLRSIEDILRGNLFTLSRIFRINQWLVELKQFFETLRVFFLGCHPTPNWHILFLKVVNWFSIWSFRRLGHLLIVFGIAISCQQIFIITNFLSLVFLLLYLTLIYLWKLLLSLPLDFFSLIYILPNLIGNSPEPTIVIVWIIQSIAHQLRYSLISILKRLPSKYIIVKILLVRINLFLHLFTSSFQCIEWIQTICGFVL